MDRRSRAREITIQALFQLDAQGSVAFDIMEIFLKENSEDDMIRSYARKWINGAWEKLDECDELIKGAALRWKLSRISPVEKSILRLCVYQLAFCEEIPPKVAINEGIELAKRYCSEQSPGFINGVLDAVNKNLQKSRKDAPKQSIEED